MSDQHNDHRRTLGHDRRRRRGAWLISCLLVLTGAFTLSPGATSMVIPSVSVAAMDVDPSASDEASAVGICNPANVCNDPDCSTATRCSAGCFGNPTCASQCGGSRCNVGCSAGPCGSGCPLQCTTTCPNEFCSSACGNPDCKVFCGGSLCNVGCADECDPVICPGNVQCRTTCGGSPCNAGCSLGICGAGCPDECDPVLCPQNRNDCLWDLADNVSNRVDTGTDRITAARDALEEIRDRVRDGAMALTTELRTSIDGALEDLKRIVAEELGGTEFVAFTDGPNSCSPITCEPFRQELLSLIGQLEADANLLFLVTGLEVFQFDLQRLQNAVSGLPGRLLFPLYIVCKVDNGDLLGSLSAQLTELGGNLDPVITVFTTDAGAPSGEVTISVCTTMTDNPLLFEVAVVRNTARAIALQLLSKLFNALGETTASGDAGIHGYTHLTYKENFPKKFAAFLEKLSKAEFFIAEGIQGKLESCLLQEVNIDADQWQIDMLNGQAQMLEAVLGNPDLNYDGELNLKDFAVFQRKFGAAGVTPP